MLLEGKFLIKSVSQITERKDGTKVNPPINLVAVVDLENGETFSFVIPVAKDLEQWHVQEQVNVQAAVSFRRVGWMNNLVVEVLNEIRPLICYNTEHLQVKGLRSL